MKTQILLLLAFICGTSAQAQLLWDKTYGSANIDQMLVRMIQLGNGGYLMVGNQEAYPNPRNVRSALAIRTNINGDTLWSFKYLPTSWRICVISDAAEDNDGNLILVGGGTLISNGDYNGFILKLNPSGDTIWTRKLVSPQSDGYYNVIIGNDNSYILNGEEFGVGVIKKINKSGITQWVRSVNFSQTDPGFVSGFTKTQNGYFAFLGANSPALGKVVKLTEAGIEQQSNFNFSVAVYDVFTKPNYNMVACGYGKLYEFNALGDTLWSKGYKINTQPISLTSAKPTSDGNYITLFDRRNGNDGDVGLMKVTPNGAVLKDTVLFRFGYNEYSRDIAVDANGDYIFAGYAEVNNTLRHIFLAKHRKWNLTLGLKKDQGLEATSIKIYPNPAIEQTTLESEKLLTGELSLYNHQGKQVWQETLSKISKKVVPLHNLPAGIYILRFASGNGKQFSRKVIKS